MCLFIFKNTCLLVLSSRNVYTMLRQILCYEWSQTGWYIVTCLFKVYMIDLSLSPNQSGIGGSLGDDVINQNYMIC